MTLQELKDMIKSQEDLNLGLLVLTMPVPKSWGRINTPFRVRCPFGLCRWYPSADPERIMVYVELDKAKRYVRKVEEHDATR